MKKADYLVNTVTGCWDWAKYKNRGGYGVKFWCGKARLAHIVEWEKVNGASNPNLAMDHLCKNRACVNPSHLEQVTTTENNRRSSATKLTADDVLSIKLSAMRNSDLARSLGVHRSTISKIRRGLSWSDMEVCK